MYIRLERLNFDDHTVRIRTYMPSPAVNKPLLQPLTSERSNSQSVDGWTVGHSKLAVARVPVPLPKLEYQHHTFLCGADTYAQ